VHVLGGQVDRRAPCLRLLLVVGPALALLPPIGTAHPGEIAPEQYVRFLSDCSDDWGGHSAVRDGHDLVALDVTERWIPEWNEGGLFVLTTVGMGYAQYGSRGGSIFDDVSLGFGSKTVVVRWSTSDNRAFKTEAGPDWKTPDLVLAPRPSLMSNGNQDGSRQLLEFGFRYSRLGIDVGSVLDHVGVQAYAGTEKGDYMPGGYWLAGTYAADCPASGSHGGQYSDILYVRRDYTMRGTERPYDDWKPSTDALSAVGNKSADLSVDVGNRFSKQEQIFTLRGTPPPGWDLAIHTGPEVVAPAGGSASWHVQLTPTTAVKNGTLRLELTSTVGAHAVHEIPAYWFATAPPVPPVRATASHGAPAPALLVAILVVAAMALARRRR
jgi:hypothetical protein